LTESLLDNNQLNDNKDYFNELVGEDKKFKTPQDLAKGKVMADQFIEQLTSENKALRQQILDAQADATARARLEELLQKFDQQQSQQQSNPNPQASVANPTPTFKPEEIESLVTNKIVEFDTRRKQQENFNTVKAKLNERYGDKASEVVQSQIEALGISIEYANDLARNHPRAFERMFGLDQPASSSTFNLPTSSGGFNKPQPKKTWTYYQKIKKENPKLYNSPEIQSEMARSYAELGGDFEDGNFKNFVR
jgi:hypothetical protein